MPVSNFILEKWLNQINLIRKRSNGFQGKYGNSSVCMPRVASTTKKKIGKITHGLGWRMPAAAKLHKWGLKDTLDVLC